MAFSFRMGPEEGPEDATSEVSCPPPPKTALEIELEHARAIVYGYASISSDEEGEDESLKNTFDANANESPDSRVCREKMMLFPTQTLGHSWKLPLR